MRPPIQTLARIAGFAAVLLTAAHAQSYEFTTLAGQVRTAAHADGTGAAAAFNGPRGIAVDGAGMIYVADTWNHVIRRITPAGVVTTLAGQPGELGSSDGTGSGARFTQPRGITVDASGTVFVVDFALGGAIRKITPAGVVTTPISNLRQAAGIVSDGNGGVYFAGLESTPDSQIRHWIRRLAADGTVTTVADRGIGSTNPGARIALTRDSAGNLYLVDDFSTVVQKISPAGVVSTVAGYAGQRGFTDGIGPNARFSNPAGITLDSTGHLFITDADSTIRRIAPTTEVTTLAGQFGQTGATNGVGGFARFDRPSDIAVDAAGNLYVADTENHIIRKGVPSNAPSPPIVSTTDGSLAQNIAIGGSAVFTVAASGANLRYQWSKNGVAIPGATTATLTYNPVTEADAGNYAVVVSNSAGTTNVAAGTLNVYATTLTSFTVRHERAGAGMLWSIASGNGLLVSVGDGGTILTSPDGRAWTRRNSGTTDWLVAVTFGAGKFVAVGDRGRILTSPDGVTWSNATVSGTTQRLNNVIHAAGKFVAVGEAGTILTSTDAQTWTPQASGVTGWLRGLAYNPAAETRTYTSYFVFPTTPTFRDTPVAAFAASGEGGAVLTSPDGVVWTRSADATSDIEALVMVPGDSNFVGIGQNGTAIEFRRFGAHSSRLMFIGYYYYWAARPHLTGTPVRLRGLAQGASALFATGENGTILAAPGVSGPWVRVPSGTSANLVGGVFHGNRLFVVGASETILESDPLQGSRLVNIATRSRVGTGADVMISGFVIAGPTPKQVLIRAAGPTLASAFGLSGALAAPILTLFDGAGRPLATNTRWGTAANAADIAAMAPRVGAFTLAAASADSALLVTLPPGAYTAQVAGADGTTGLSLTEVYDSDAAGSGSRVVNISTRGQVGAGDARMIAGFFVDGAASRRVLIRAMGPALAPLGVAGALAEPQLEVFNDRGVLQFSARAWSARPDAEEIRSASRLAGAFLPAENSRDAAAIATLVPGAYTVQVSGLNDTTGIALVEVYDLP